MSKGTETRERIVARAADVFNVTGYAGTAISDIMRVTGLEKGGIYRHFASKDELVLAAFDYAAGQVRARFAEGLAGTTHAADRLLAFVDVFSDYAQRPPLTGGCPILNTAIESDDTNPALAERAAAVVAEWRSQIRITVQQGVAQGEIRPEVDADKLALVLVATLEGAVMLARLLRDAT
ncbi:MAG TPA: TetR/AcrR family transcriptional regulator, partial [Chloroflexaceae bacterium]|nr:TetR/AcrR family transcriptional regulator [Chloroflexaceae bacterium]